MDWRIELQGDGKVIRVTTRGPFQLQQQRQMFEDLGAHPDFSQQLGVLFDNRRLDMSDSTEDDIRQSVDIVQAFIRAQHIERLAGLVDNGLNFGIGRQFETLMDAKGGRGFRLFNDELLALRWLCDKPL